jgi:hypothetical protein
LIQLDIEVMFVNAPCQDRQNMKRRQPITFWFEEIQFWWRFARITERTSASAIVGIWSGVLLKVSFPTPQTGEIKDSRVAKTHKRSKEKQIPARSRAQRLVGDVAHAVCPGSRSSLVKWKLKALSPLMLVALSLWT